jgi:hypothetical protein
VLVNIRYRGHNWFDLSYCAFMQLSSLNNYIPYASRRDYCLTLNGAAKIQSTVANRSYKP